MGITQRDLPGVDIRNLSVLTAETYYHDHFWPFGYSAIDSQAVANKLFDMGVLFGLAEAIMLLQLVLLIHADGAFGGMTLAAVNAQPPDQLLAQYKQRMIDHARKIVARSPSSMIFLQGWINRINA